jgi:hypothetical protein
MIEKPFVLLYYISCTAILLFLGCFSQLVNHIHSQYGSLDRGSACHNASAYTGQHKQNNRTQTSMPRLGFEATTPTFVWKKTVHIIGPTATVIVK